VTVPASGSTREALRSATHERHEALHAAGPFAALMDGRLTREGYGRLLLRLYGFHRPLEDALLAPEASAELARFGLDPARLKRAGRLRLDLAALGMGPDEMDAAPRVALAPAAAPGWAMGRLYVREGSTLGGRVMARRLDGLLGSGDAARLFLAGAGAGAGDGGDVGLWRDCCRAVEACGADPRRRAAMVAAALDVFERFADWFRAS
jgi:heme oxygenase